MRGNACEKMTAQADEKSEHESNGQAIGAGRGEKTPPPTQARMQGCRRYRPRMDMSAVVPAGTSGTYAPNMRCQKSAGDRLCRRAASVTSGSPRVNVVMFVAMGSQYPTEIPRERPMERRSPPTNRFRLALSAHSLASSQIVQQPNHKGLRITTPG